MDQYSRLMEEAERRGHRFPRKGAIVRPQRNPIEWRVNVTQIKTADGDAVDGTDADELSAGEIEGRRQALAFADFLRRDVPGFADAYMVDIPPQIGIRETRRITGHYQLSGDDVITCASFADTIGVNGWPIENHVAGNVRVALAADPAITRLQPPALSDAAATCRCATCWSPDAARR